ncbi:MAG TPA: HisA/HisF-related TIM barrel protein, partial [Chitinophagales bacterium]|nr:HisA/HisF-related TIM barrel protein [Chitinophagales bacterium]
EGPSFELYSNILEEYEELKLIASGGVSSIDDLQKLKEMGCYAAIVGKAFYEGRITLKELSSFQ